MTSKRETRRQLKELRFLQQNTGPVGSVADNTPEVTATLRAKRGQPILSEIDRNFKCAEIKRLKRKLGRIN